MKKPKIAYLVESLSALERKNFQSVIKEKRRQQLFKLYKIVISELKKEKFSNERVYELLYQSPYDKKKNYLLRNELRLLSNELKSFIVYLTFNDKLKSEPETQTLFYLQGLFGKTDAEFFLSECQKALDSAIKNQDNETATQIFKLYIQAFIKSVSPTYEKYMELLDFLKKNEEITIQAFLQNWVEVQKFKAFTQKSLNAMHPTQGEISIPNFLKMEFENENQNASYFQYQLLWAKSYASKGLEKIQILKDAEKYISKINKTKFSNESEIAKVNASIALDYFLLEKYQFSIEYHEKCLLQKKHLNDKDFAVYLFNYISTLLRMDDFRKALELISEHEKLLLKQERLHDRFLNIKAMCLLLLNQIDEAETCLPHERKEGGMYNYFYFRVVQSMVFYERREYDLAINELHNLQYSLHYNQLKNSGFKELTKYLQIFYKLQRDQKFISNYQTDKQNLINEINSLENKSQYLLPYKWLLQELI